MIYDHVRLIRDLSPHQTSVELGKLIMLNAAAQKHFAPSFQEFKRDRHFVQIRSVSHRKTAGHTKETKQYKAEISVVCNPNANDECECDNKNRKHRISIGVLPDVRNKMNRYM